MRIYITLFVYLLILFYLFFNKYIWGIFFINLFTNFNNNYVLLIYLFVCLFIYFFNKNISLFILINLFLLNILKKNIIALDNILFIYHPYLLYFSIFFINFLFFFAKKQSFSKFILLSWFSFILGGFWASQEFNWGGWWNWDSLELGVCYALIFYTTVIHINVFFYKYIYYYYLIFYFLINYWVFNKLGLTVSIHSFIQNTFLYKYVWLSYIYIFFFKINYIWFFNVFLYNLINPVISIFSYKLFVLYLFFFFKNFFFKKIYYKMYHKCLFLLIFCFFLINYFNLTFYKNSIIFSKIFYLNIYKLNIKLFDSVIISVLKKNFFFFKFKNFNYFQLNWLFSVKNFFSNYTWFLLF